MKNSRIKKSLWLALASFTLGQSAFANTSVSIIGKDFYLNNIITHSSPGQRGMLPNSRMVQATFDDANPATVNNWAYPDTHKWDPNRQTQEFINALPAYRKAGLLAVTLNLQGGRPKASFKSTTQPDINTAVKPDGSLDPVYLTRLDKAIRALDANGMVAILGIFYGGQSTRVSSDAAVKVAVNNVVDWILAQKYTNVMLEIANESSKGHFPTHPILQQGNIATLVTQARTRAGGKLLVSASLSGGAVPPASLINASDFILIHGNGLSASGVTSLVKKVRSMTNKPIVFNEDSTSVSNYAAAVKAGASWGYYDAGKNNYVDGFQYPPTNWSINTSKKKAFFNMISTL